MFCLYSSSDTGTDHAGPVSIALNDQRPWHALSPEFVLNSLAANSSGLSTTDAAARHKVCGPNELPRDPPTHWGIIVLRQLANPIILVLIAAAAVSLCMQDAYDALFIAFVVAVNTTIGAFQEHRADRSARALQRLLRFRAVVLRDLEPVELDASALVVGDVVLLESGYRVPADVRLLWSHALKTDESLLTGESLTVGKDAAHVLEESIELAERSNMAYAGSLVTSGRGRGLVVATGSGTEVGRLAIDVMQAPAGAAPLVLRLKRFSRSVGVLAIIASMAVGLIGVFFRGFGLGEMFKFGVALAVSAIPEGLPVAITVALAVAASRMAQRGVIVRRLHAVEGLGSCSMIASDKTGTLTCNQLTVREIRLRDGMTLNVTGEGFCPDGELRDGNRTLAPGSPGRWNELLRTCVLCNEGSLKKSNGHWSWLGDPTDVALLTAAYKAGIEPEVERAAFPLKDLIPFEPERRFAASYHEINGRLLVAVKGSPEQVLSMCAGETALYALEAESMARRGLRVLAIATGWDEQISRDHHVPREPRDLDFLGLVGMIDPLRPGARKAIESCQAAGIHVCMITGDHPVTATAIARDLGLVERADQVVTGAMLEHGDKEKLDSLIRETRVFARVAPRQKLDIVRAAQRAGELVAVTGDGVNDAPALRAANIGVAMGFSGTDVAREASDLVITDDQFSTIKEGIEQGRIAYDNIRKVVLLLISTGAAEVVVVALAVVFGTPIPLLPAQLLWLNLVTNGIQDVALAFEPGEDDVMQRAPRPSNEALFNRLMVENTVLTALIMGLLGFGAFVWMLQAGWTDLAARNGLLLLMVLFEFVHIGNCRSETRSAFYRSPLRSPFLFFGAISALGLHCFMMHIPLGGELLGIHPVSLQVWAALGGLALVPLIVFEMRKAFRAHCVSEE